MGFYICPYFYLYQRILCFIVQHPFNLDSIQHFLQGRSNGGKFHWFLFIWECVCFSLVFEGQFHWIWYSQMSFFSFSICHPTAFWPSVFLLRNMLIEYAFYIMRHVSAFKIISLSLMIHSLIKICHSMGSFGAFLHEVFVELGFVNPCLSSNLGTFRPLFLQISSLPLSLPVILLGLA